MEKKGEVAEQQDVVMRKESEVSGADNDMS
jgi:hypothetical protein